MNPISLLASNTNHNIVSKTWMLYNLIQLLIMNPCPPLPHVAPCEKGKLAPDTIQLHVWYLSIEWEEMWCVRGGCIIRLWPSLFRSLVVLFFLCMRNMYNFLFEPSSKTIFLTLSTIFYTQKRLLWHDANEALYNNYISPFKVWWIIALTHLGNKVKDVDNMVEWIEIMLLLPLFILYNIILENTPISHFLRVPFSEASVGIKYSGLCKVY